jgi:two-component sensor histidine kinase
MPRKWTWLQLAMGWLPVWALYTALVAFQHGIEAAHAAGIALKAVLPAALLGLVVLRFTRRLPWPRPFRATFLAVHVAAALTYALAWVVSLSLVESLLRGAFAIVVGPGLLPFFALGVWLYAMVAGVSYATEATERAALAEAEAARAELEALRAQLHPHFVFNALHSVVQLIPEDPARAAQAAEEIAHLLRATIEEDRDLVTLADEWAFVERYVSLERLRFGDRLRVEADLGDGAATAIVPSFALQTLVENAIRHGAAPRAEPTTVSIRASRDGRILTLAVQDDGAGASPERFDQGAGSGLTRLRARLRALYGDAADLSVVAAERGVTATLRVPQMEDDA